MAAVKSKKAPVKKTPTKKTQKPAPVAADAGSKRKRVSFDTKETAKKSKKQPVKEESSEDEVEIPHEDDDELTEEQEEALRKEILGDIASSSEGEDSSDEEEDGIDKNDGLVTLDGKKLEQSKAETKDAFMKKLNKAQQLEEEKGVIYLGRIPHGFYEKEMRGYFSQFGDITRLRLSRNKKTGKPKHYGFIEFQSSQVAEIVAETMNNYLLFGHMLKCQVIPAEKVHDKLFHGSDKVYKPFNYELRNRQIHNKKLSAEELSVKCDKLKQTEEKLRKAIEDAGIDYDFPGFS
ncbi:hypothetical protein EDC96DRAFT_610768 [Choanephora cucurbitarum]|nr:hypothetical protein EDC96DRAFT_610768 [Choanephora cucurbitarum]